MQQYEQGCVCRVTTLTVAGVNGFGLEVWQVGRRWRCDFVLNTFRGRRVRRCLCALLCLSCRSAQTPERFLAGLRSVFLSLGWCVGRSSCLCSAGECTVCMRLEKRNVLGSLKVRRVWRLSPKSSRGGPGGDDDVVTGEIG